MILKRKEWCFSRVYIFSFEHEIGCNKKARTKNWRVSLRNQVTSCVRSAFDPVSYLSSTCPVTTAVFKANYNDILCTYQWSLIYHSMQQSKTTFYEIFQYFTGVCNFNVSC